MSKPRYQYDEPVIVDFGGGEEYTGEIDTIDFEEDPEYPYRVWYDTPRPDPVNPEDTIECEWVRPSMLSHIKQEEATHEHLSGS